jgi:hypothetical protein
VLACLVAAAAGAWLAFLNGLVVLHTESVTVGVEAGAFGAAGLVIAVGASRAAWGRRGRQRQRPPAATLPPDDDDPLARFRRWRVR